jgi:hypothetical protein
VTVSGALEGGVAVREEAGESEPPVRADWPARGSDGGGVNIKGTVQDVGGGYLMG